MTKLFAAPAQIIIDPTGTTPFVIDKDDQVEDASVSVELDIFELMSLASSRPQGIIRTGAHARLTVVFADMSRLLEMMAMLYDATVVTSTTKRRVTVTDGAGAEIPNRKVLVKPYIGELPDPNANNWLTFPAAKIVDLSGSNLAYGLRTQQRLSVAFDAFRDSNGNKLIIGDETA